MEHLYNYLDELLVVQSKAADRHNHKGVLGAVREEFIKTIIVDRLDWLKERVQTGEIVIGTKHFGQQDILIRKEGSVNTALGGQSLLRVEDAAAIIEIKTNAKLTEITKFDEVAKKLKEANPNLVAGFLCYKLNGTRKTVLKRAGYTYDKELDRYESTIEPNYKAIDFIISLDKEFHNGEEKSFYLQRDQLKDLYSFKPTGPFSEYLLFEVIRADKNSND